MNMRLFSLAGAFAEDDRRKLEQLLAQLHAGTGINANALKDLQKIWGETNYNDNLGTVADYIARLNTESASNDTTRRADPVLVGFVQQLQQMLHQGEGALPNLDQNQDGKISQTELSEGFLTALDLELEANQSADEIFDLDGNGTVDAIDIELLVAMIESKQREQEAKRLNTPSRAHPAPLSSPSSSGMNGSGAGAAAGSPSSSGARTSAAVVPQRIEGAQARGASGPRAEAALAWARAQMDPRTATSINANNDLSLQQNIEAWDNWCLGFVATAFGRTVAELTSDSAINAFQRFMDAEKIAQSRDIPAGAPVFFQATESNGHGGHIAIATGRVTASGDPIVISSGWPGRSGVFEITLSALESLTGNYIGYGIVSEAGPHPL